MSSMLKRLNKQNKEYISEYELSNIEKEIKEIEKKSKECLEKRDFQNLLKYGKRLKTLKKRLKYSVND